jgi:hypothetical protein
MHVMSSVLRIIHGDNSTARRRWCCVFKCDDSVVLCHSSYKFVPPLPLSLMLCW